MVKTTIYHIVIVLINQLNATQRGSHIVLTMIISIISQITTNNTCIYFCYTSMYTNYCGGSISFCFNKNPHELHLLQHQLIPLGSPGARTTNLCRVPEGISCNTRICIKTWRRRAQLIGLRENLQENPIFHGKIYGFL